MAGKIANGGRAAYIYTATNGTNPTIGVTPVLTLTDQIDTQIAYDDTATPTVTINSTLDDSSLETFRQTYCVGAATTGTPEDITYEDGTTVLGASQTGQVLYMIVAGGTVQGGADNGKKMGWHGFVAAGKAIGSWTQSGGTFGKPALSFVGLPCEGTLTVASTYMTSIMVTAAAQTLNQTTKKLGAKFYG